ncbi:MAG TPA: cation diffusion facilitator family transporter [Burkholderiales bacterium]
MTAHHHHAHDQGPRSGQHAFAIALTVTLAYAFIELWGGLWSGSLALISDAGHMFSDVLALALAALAAWLARRPAGYRHSYGWARAEVIGALLNGLLMLAVVVWLVVEAVQRLLEPRPVAALGVLVIAFIGLLVNALVAYIVGHSEDSLNRRAALLHVLGDLVSSLAALIAGAVIYFTGWVMIDPILSLVIGGLILMSTLNLLRETLHVLMEGVPHAVNFEQIGSALATIRGVARVHDLHVWSIASNRIALSAHLEIGRLEEWPRILHDSRALLHDRFDIEHVTLQPEEHRPHGHRATVTLWLKGRRRS